MSHILDEQIVGSVLKLMMVTAQASEFQFLSGSLSIVSKVPREKML
jgi:hypothetical protein